MSSEAKASIGHNNPPVTIPEEEALIADLDARYPQVAKDLAEIELAAKDVPVEIRDEETAGKVQALLKKTSSLRAQWKALRGVEKRPWSAVVAIVGNWFETSEERADKIIESLKPRHTFYLDTKVEAARVAAEQEVERQRQESERLKKEAEAAEAKRQEAEAAKIKAQEEEAAAIKRKEEADAARVAAEAAAAAAKAEEDRIAKEKRDRERAERDRNVQGIKDAKAAMKIAERLHEAAAEQGVDDAATNDMAALDAMIRFGGTISTLMGPVASSAILDEEQKDEVAGMRIRLETMRKDMSDRLDARARRRQEKLRKEEEAQEAAAAEKRRLAKIEDDAKEEAARVASEAAEAEAANAKAAHKDAQGEVREARGAVRGATADVKHSERTAATLDRQADKAESRAERTELKAANLTDADASRTRGEGGSVGTLSGSWKPRFDDRDAIPLEALRADLHPAAVDAAVTLWQRRHQQQWADKRKDGKVEGALPGVTFIWVPDSRIAG